MSHSPKASRRPEPIDVGVKGRSPPAPAPPSPAFEYARDADAELLARQTPLSPMAAKQSLNSDVAALNSAEASAMADGGPPDVGPRGASTNGSPNERRASVKYPQKQRVPIPDRVFDFSESQLLLALEYCAEDVLAAVDSTLRDRYLEELAAGNDDKALSNDSISMVSSNHTSANNRGLVLAAAGGGKGLGAAASGAPSDGGLEVPTGSIAKYVRPPHRTNPFRTTTEVLETVLPFALILPVAVFGVLLTIYLYVDVGICGDDCGCTPDNAALFLFTFGLMRDVPYAVVFACLTEACVRHQLAATATTAARARRARYTKEMSRVAGMRQDFGSSSLRLPASASSRVSQQRSPPGHDDAFAVTVDQRAPTHSDEGQCVYGPYVLEPALTYLMAPSVWLMAGSAVALCIAFRAFATPIGIPHQAQFPLLLGLKCAPFIAYSSVRRHIFASASVCAVILMPLGFEVIAPQLHRSEDVRRQLTACMPAIVLVIDRLLLLLLKAAEVPTQSVGASTICTTMHAFFSQCLLLGVGVTINGGNSASLIAVYTVTMAIVELFLNTVLPARFGSWCFAAITARCVPNSDAVSAKAAPMCRNALGNIAALVRLPTLLLAFVLLLPAMHFPKYPHRTQAISCDGRTHYDGSWATYGALVAVCVTIALATCLMRRMHGPLAMPLFVHGWGWALLTSLYLLTLVPQALSYLPAVGGHTEGGH